MVQKLANSGFHMLHNSFYIYVKVNATHDQLMDVILMERSPKYSRSSTIHT